MECSQVFDIEFEEIDDATAPSPHRYRRATNKKRQAMSKKLRFSVLRRDNFVCQYCGARPPGVTLHVDHRLSVADGGTNDFENLVTACETCNSGKGARSLGPQRHAPQRRAAPIQPPSAEEPYRQGIRSGIESEPGSERIAIWMRSLSVSRLVAFLNGEIAGPPAIPPPDVYPW